MMIRNIFVVKIHKVLQYVNKIFNDILILTEDIFIKV